MAPTSTSQATAVLSNMAGNSSKYDRMQILMYVAIALGCIILIAVVAFVVCKIKGKGKKAKANKAPRGPKGKPHGGRLSRRGSSVHPESESGSEMTGISPRGKPTDMRSPRQLPSEMDNRKLAMSNSRKQNQRSEL